MKYLIIIAVVFLLDIYSKYLVERKIELKKMKKIIGEKFIFYHVRNYGLALNKLSGKKVLILLINLGVLLYLIYMYIEFPEYRLGLSFAIGGGLGNSLERLYKGYVVDFICFNYRNIPIFNIADFGIFFGAILLLIREVLHGA